MLKLSSRKNRAHSRNHGLVGSGRGVVDGRNDGSGERGSLGGGRDEVLYDSEYEREIFISIQHSPTATETR